MAAIEERDDEANGLGGDCEYFVLGANSKRRGQHDSRSDCGRAERRRVSQLEIGRVEMWRGSLGLAQLFPTLSVAGASLS
jgi:hypothetical protein